MLTPPRVRTPRGLTFVEMVVALALVATVAIVIIVSPAVSPAVNRSSSIDNVEKAARTLQDLSEAIALWTNRGTGGQPSFLRVIGANPSALSQLTFPISTADRNSCAKSTPVSNTSKFSSSQSNKWTGGFFRQELPPTGFLVAPGFFADDTLRRYSTVFNPGGPPYFQEEYFSSNNSTTPGTLAIVMRNVKYSDALALAQRVEGDTSAIFGAVRFTKNVTNAPVDVEYHIAIHGC